MRNFDFAVSGRRNDRLDFPVHKNAPEVARIICLVGQQIFDRRQRPGKRDRAFYISPLPRRYIQRQRPAFHIANGVKLCIAPAAAYADGFLSSPLFAPPAQR